MSGYNLEISQQKKNLRLLTQELKHTKTNDNTKDKESFVVKKNVADEEVPTRRTMQLEMEAETKLKFLTL